MAASRDFSDEFPEELTTRSHGTLHLQVTELRWSGPDGEDQLLKGCSYRSDDNSVGFNVDESKPPNIERWLQVLESRASEYEQGWRAILIAAEEELQGYVQGWLPEGTSTRDLLEQIELKGLSVGDDGSVSLAFGEIALLHHHDLGVELGPDNAVRDVIVEG